ncbi:MAG: hypothetical protein QM650_07160 [Microlunatus sp.]
MTGPRPPRGVEPLDRHRIKALFAMLDERLRSRGVAAALYVVGGAAVAVTIADRRVTHDVDVAGLDPVVAEEARAIAAAENLPPDWLNAAATPWIPAPSSVTSNLAAGLSIRYAPPEHLLAMKMVALRQQDAPDIAALADHLGLIRASPDRFAAMLRLAYPGEGQLQQVLGVPEEQVDQEVEAIARRVVAFTSRTDSAAD